MLKILRASKINGAIEHENLECLRSCKRFLVSSRVTCKQQCCRVCPAPCAAPIFKLSSAQAGDVTRETGMAKHKLLLNISQDIVVQGPKTEELWNCTEGRGVPQFFVVMRKGECMISLCR